MTVYPRTHSGRAAFLSGIVVLLIALAAVAGWVAASQRGTERDTAQVERDTAQSGERQAKDEQAVTEQAATSLLDKLDDECDTVTDPSARQARICDAAAEAAQTITGAPIPGPQGSTGATGQDGADGLDGLDGARGPRGPRGPAGLTGPQGPPGPTGADGTDGADGQQGPAGPAGPAGKDGADGTPGAQGPPGPSCPEGSSLTARTLLTPAGAVDAFVCTPDPAP